MSEGHLVLAVVEALGPPAVLLLAVLLAFALIKTNLTRVYRERHRVRFRERQPASRASDELTVALDSAIEFNSLNVHARYDPSVRLQEVIRFTPASFSVASREISQLFREQEVISIDLSVMEVREAARLVDFCSGMAAATSGWIFRVTDDVIVLTPSA